MWQTTDQASGENQFNWVGKPWMECAFDRLMKEEGEKTPHLRSTSFLLVCTCPKCQRIVC